MALKWHILAITVCLGGTTYLGICMLDHWRSVGVKGEPIVAKTSICQVSVTTVSEGGWIESEYAGLSYDKIFDLVEEEETRDAWIAKLDDALDYLLEHDLTTFQSYLNSLSYLQIRALAPAYMYLRWHQRDPIGASAWFQQQFPQLPFNRSLLEMNLRAMLLKPGFLEIEAVTDLEPGLKAAGLAQVIGENINDYLEDCWRLVYFYEEHFLREHAELAFGHSLIKAKPENALDYIQQFKSKARAEAVSLWALDRIQIAPDDVFDALADLNDPALEQVAAQRAMRQWANTAPEDALKFLEERSLSDSLSIAIYCAVAESIAATSSATALNILEQIDAPDSDRLRESYRRIYATVVHDDFSLAQEFWASNQNKIERDMLASEIIDYLSYVDRRQAFEWVGRIHNEALRMRWAAEFR